MTLEFTVYGAAQPKGNMRVFNLDVKGMKIPIITERNRNVKGWQQLIAQRASVALDELPAAERAMNTLGVRLTIAFYLPRPKSLKKRGVFVPHCKTPDIDKLERAVLDALTNLAYRDDKQVVEVIKGKYYAAVDAPPCVVIRVEPAPDQVLTPRPLETPLFAELVS